MNTTPDDEVPDVTDAELANPQWPYDPDVEGQHGAPDDEQEEDLR